MMRTIRLIFVAVFALAVTGLAGAEARDLGPHPVRGWQGNHYLFEVKPHGDVIYLVAYRGIGKRWQQVGVTSISPDQREPSGSWLQDIWFHGRELGHVEADLKHPFWRYYPGEDSGGAAIR